MPDGVEVSYHAIDKASLRAVHAWKVDAKNDEGLFSWLMRVSNEAVVKFPKQERVRYKGMTLVFAYGNHFPTLKTVLVSKRHGKKSTN